MIHRKIYNPVDRCRQAKCQFLKLKDKNVNVNDDQLKVHLVHCTLTLRSNLQKYKLNCGDATTHQNLITADNIKHPFTKK